MILLYEADYLDSQIVCLQGRRKKHVEQVLQAKVGDCLKVGRINGLIGTGEIVAHTPEQIVMRVRCDQPPPDPGCVELVLALPRPKVLKRTLIAAVTLGVKRISLINSWRVEKSFWQSPLLNPDKIQTCLVEALEQCCDTILPQVEFFPRFKPFVEDLLPARLQDRQGIVAHPYGQTMKKVPSSQGYVLAIGPEGGFIPYEVDLLCRQGMVPLVLGTRILRVETAVVSALSRLGTF